MPPGDRASPFGLILKRARSDWLVLAAALLTVLMASALLAAGPIYSDAVTLSTLRQTLQSAEPDEVNIAIEIGGLPPQFSSLDEAVSGALGAELEDVGTSVNRIISVGAFELPTQTSTEKTDIVEFRYLEGIERHASLSSGRWPVASAGSIEISISEPVSELLDLGIGDQLELTNRRDRSDRISVTVVGVYRVSDPEDPYWFAEELTSAGVEGSPSFDTYGPLVIERTTALTRLGGQRIEATWRLLPDSNLIGVDDLASVAAAVAGLESRLNRSPAVTETATGSAYRVSTRLDTILSDIERSLAVTRSGVLMVTIQLAVLAGYSLALTAGLLTETRRGELALLRARGASNRQSLVIAAVEAAALTIPAALLAPWLASASLRALNGVGPLAAIGLELDPRVTSVSYVIALAAAFGATLSLAIPAYRASRTFNQTFLAKGRQGTRGAAQRQAIDIALLVLAGLAIWQLETFGPQITAAGRRVIGVDPLLVLAPAIGLFAGAVLALRIVPLLARVAERLVVRGRSAVAALTAWQLARRPLRYARSGLLLMMATAIGFFTATYSDTWITSQGDQAAYEVGGDLRVIPNRRTNDSLADLHLDAAHLAIDGVEATMPVGRFATQLARSGSIGQFLLIDAREADSVITFRPDLADGDLGSMLQELSARRPELAAIELPGQPKRVALVLDLRVKPLDWTPDFELRNRPIDIQHDFLPTARVTIQDGSGFLHRLDLGDVPVNRGPARLEFGLAEILGNGSETRPTYPLSIVDIELVALAPFHTLRQGSISVASVVVNDAGIGGEWETAIDAGAIAWDLSAEWSGSLFASPTIEQSNSSGQSTLVATFSTGVSFGGFRTSVTPVHYSFRPSGTHLPEVIPVIVGEPLLEKMAVSVGDSIRFPDLGDVRAEIVGTVEMFPTIDPDSGDVIVADFPTYQMLSMQVGASPRPADEWWLRTGGGQAGTVSSELMAEPIESAMVLSQEKISSTLTSDPIALGTIGSLSIGFVAAAVFAGVGFAVSGTVSARERLHEYAMLRALGLSPPQLFRWVAMEHGGLLFVSLLIGSGVGWLLGSLTLPVISITQDGSRAVPEALVVHPWGVILTMELSILGVLFLFVLVLHRLLKRLGLGSILRIGGD